MTGALTADGLLSYASVPDVVGGRLGFDFASGSVGLLMSPPAAVSVSVSVLTTAGAGAGAGVARSVGLTILTTAGTRVASTPTVWLAILTTAGTSAGAGLALMGGAAVGFPRTMIVTRNAIATVQ